MAIIFAAAFFAFIWFSRTSDSASSSIRVASAIDSKPTFASVVSGQRTIGTFRAGDLLSSDDIYIRLGSSKLEWSIAGAESGYLYCSSDDLKQGPWEFAPCSARKLSEVRPTDTRRKFYGGGDTNGANAFGQNWLQQENAIRVHVGDLLFARQANKPAVVYLIRLKSQESMKVQVEYLEMRID